MGKVPLKGLSVLDGSESTVHLLHVVEIVELVVLICVGEQSKSILLGVVGLKSLEEIIAFRFVKVLYIKLGSESSSAHGNNVLGSTFHNNSNHGLAISLEFDSDKLSLELSIEGDLGLNTAESAHSNHLVLNVDFVRLEELEHAALSAVALGYVGVLLTHLDSSRLVEDNSVSQNINELRI